MSPYQFLSWFLNTIPKKNEAGQLGEKTDKKYGNMSERHRIDLEEVPTEKKLKKFVYPSN